MMRKISLSFVIGITALMALSQCKSAPKETPSTTASKVPEVVSMASPAGPGSGEPNLSTGPDGRIYLTWIESEEGKNSLKFSVLNANRTWSPAAVVAQGEHWFVN